jgi:hypothetical protein
MFQEKVLRFLGAYQEWNESIFEKPPVFSTNNLPGNPEDCLLFSRECDIQDMQSEDDEAYFMSTPDYRVSTRLDRFQVKDTFKRLGPVFTPEKIEFLIKMAWNWPKIAVNKKTGEHEPYKELNDNLPPMPASGGPPRKTVYVNE